MTRRARSPELELQPLGQDQLAICKTHGILRPSSRGEGEAQGLGGEAQEPALPGGFPYTSSSHGALPWSFSGWRSASG